MFNRGKLFAAFVLSASTCAVAAYAQTTPPAAPAQPSQPKIAQPQFQFFTNADEGSYLGVQLQEVTKDNFSKFGLREVRGVAIEKVTENSPAAQAGLKDGDVIVRYGNEEVASAKKLSRLVGETAPDHQEKVTVLRGGSEREVTVTLGKRPTPKLDFVFESGQNRVQIAPGAPLGQMPQLNQMPQIMRIPEGTTVFPPSGNGDGQNFFYFNRDSRQIGVGVSALSKQLGDYFGVSDGKGVLINNVRENSPAAKAGLKAGDVIVEVDGKAVGNTVELTRAVNEKKEGDVNVTVVRNRNRQTIKVTPEKMQGGGGNIQLQDLYEKDGNNPAQPQLRRLTVKPGTVITPGVQLKTAPRIL